MGVWFVDLRVKELEASYMVYGVRQATIVHEASYHVREEKLEASYMVYGVRQATNDVMGSRPKGKGREAREPATLCVA